MKSVLSLTPLISPLHPITAAQVLYELHPDLRTKAIAMVTDLSDTITDRSLKVSTQTPPHGFECDHTPLHVDVSKGTQVPGVRYTR